MFDNVELFLGFSMDPLFTSQLDKVNPLLKAQYIGEEEGLLHTETREGLTFIGKPLGKSTSLESLELQEANIYSILKRLVPQFPYDETPLYLFSTTPQLK